MGVAGAEGFDWEGAEDLTALTEEELRANLEALAEEERTLRYMLRILEGRMDLMRAELVRRGVVALPPAGLARARLGEGSEAGRPS